MPSRVALALVILVFSATPFYSVRADESKSMVLPKPRTDQGRPLMQVLKDRATSRDFSADKVSMQTLSDLLWAAFGINRPDSRKRTAPSARNWQEIDIYVALSEGLYLFDAREHRLEHVTSEDVRAMTGRQAFVKDAPVNLIYVADTSRMSGAKPDEIDMYAGADTGFISQNVYLFCASEGLATVVRASIDREALARAMKLRPDQKITLAQTVGHPGK